jgi:hypothetical protein
LLALGCSCIRPVSACRKSGLIHIYRKIMGLETITAFEEMPRSFRPAKALSVTNRFFYA